MVLLYWIEEKPQSKACFTAEQCWWCDEWLNYLVKIIVVWRLMFIFCCNPRLIKRFQCLLAQLSVRRALGRFVLLNFSPNPCARLNGWKTLKLHKLQQIMLVLFEIYIRKLIIRIESWFWSYHEGYEWNNRRAQFCMAGVVIKIANNCTILVDLHNFNI